MSHSKQIQRRFIEEVWNKGQLQTAHELLAPGVSVRSFGRELTGVDGVAEATAQFRSAFPDLHLTVTDQIEEGDSVVARWTATATHGGPLLGFAATGRKITFDGHTIDTIHNGRIASTFTSIDPLEILLKIGVEPRVDTRKLVVQRLFAEVWSSGKYDVADELVAADAKIGTHSGETGPEGLKARVRSYRSGLPDLTVEVSGQIAEGDQVLSTWVVRGHHRGALMGIPATGRHVAFLGSSIERVSHGKITESNAIVDVLELLVQLGAVVQSGS